MDLNSDPNIRSPLCANTRPAQQQTGGNAGAAAARLICRNTDTARLEVGAGHACMHKRTKTD